MGDGLLIRPARPDDHDALVEQYQGLNIHEDAIAGDRRRDREAAERSVADALRLVRETEGHALVAEVAGRVVGHVFLLFKDDPVYVRAELRHYAYISELYVRTAARGGGIGSALIAAAERLAAARGVRRLVIGVLAGNTGAERLYARHGFAPRAIELMKPLG